MSFCSSSPESDPFVDALSEHSRLFLVGVENYDNFPSHPVKSATNNVVAWLIQAMRMGISPFGNPIAHDASRARLREIAREVVANADLSEQVRGRVNGIVKGWLSDPSGQSLMRPTFHNLLRGVCMGWHLCCFPQSRMLMVFSGHGALSGDHVVLCPSDAESTPQPRSEASLCAAITRWIRQVERAPLVVGEGVDAGAVVNGTREVLEDLRSAAMEKAVLAEVVDILAVPIGDMVSGRYRAEVLLNQIRFIWANLDLVPDQRGAAPPDFGRVINPVHMVLGLGPSAERVTVVLDACHSGGLGADLTGSDVTHNWIRDFGLRCRILSSSQKAQLSAEATVGDRRYSAATWALTSVLSRWKAVEELPAYAMGISNGNLVLRANLLLDALSFNQKIGLSAPRPEPGHRAAADLPFMGHRAETLTHVDPNSDADGIQLASDDNTLTSWEIRLVDGTLKAVLLAVGQSVASPPVCAPVGSQALVAGKLYVLGMSDAAASLAGQSFNLKMFKYDVNASAWPSGSVLASPPTGLALRQTVNAQGDEEAYDTTGPKSVAGGGGYASYQKPGGGRTIWMKWVAAAGAAPARLIFVLAPDNAVYTPADFAVGTQEVPNPTMGFSPATPNPAFDSSRKMHIISLSS